MSQVRTALIIGGGIAGLSSAIALRQNQFEVTVVEVGDGQATGASVSINGGAVDAIEKLGVVDECIAVGTVFDSKSTFFQNLFDANGNRLPIPPPPGRKDDRLPASIQLYRPVFADILQQKAHELGVNIHTNTTFKHIDYRHSDKAVVTLSNGSVAEYDLVLGADGISSSVRAACFEISEKPQYTGSIAFRWMHSGKLDGVPGLYNHPDGKTIVLTAELPNDFHYFITGIYGPQRHIDQAEAQAITRDILSGFKAPRMNDMHAKLSSENTMMVSAFNWLLVPKPWFRNRVCLLGDAAHATTANLSYGAGLALEDAVVLGEEFAQHSDIPSALSAYQERRFERVNMVVDTSVKLMQLAQSGAPEAESGKLRHQAFAQLMEPF